jgi:two-component system response regulator LytT
MAQTNVLVVEDESIVSKDIQHSLKKLGYNVVGAASHRRTGRETGRGNQPDIILMDIMLKGEMNGIEAATQIRCGDQHPGDLPDGLRRREHLNKAKVTQPYGYIIKPFKEIDIHTSIEMALYKHKKEAEVLKERDLLFNLVENQGGTKDLLFVKSNSRMVKLRTSDIYYIEALKDYVVINTLNTRYTIHSTMKDIEVKLPDSEFLRVHRSFIVRIDKIVAIEQPNLILENDKKIIPIGGSYKDDLAKRLNLV